MLTRKELESMGIKMTDEQWADFQNQLSDIQDKIWEEEHPLDDQQVSIKAWSYRNLILKTGRKYNFSPYFEY